MFDEALTGQATALLDDYRSAGVTLATAESCTGGLIAACLTEIAGSSDVFERGFVTYSNAAKQACLGLPAETLARHGAVSAETAEAMAAGALAHSLADVALSATGIAGPGGATPDKPVGLVYFGLCHRGAAPRHRRFVFPGDRAAIRRAALETGLDLAGDALKSDGA